MLFTTVTSETVGIGQRKSFTNPAKFTIDASFQEKAAFAPWWSNMMISSGVCFVLFVFKFNCSLKKTVAKYKRIFFPDLVSYIYENNVGNL